MTTVAELEKLRRWRACARGHFNEVEQHHTKEKTMAITTEHSPGRKRLIVDSTTPSPEETYLCDLYIGQIGVMAENDGPMPAGHYLRTYEEYVYLEDPTSTYITSSFDGERDSFYAINILNPGSVVTLKVT